MKKLLLSSLAVLTLTLGSQAQNVNIPDANFKAYLLGNASINTDADPNEISVVEAAAYTGSINCPSLNISDLTGIEAFTALTELWCFSNNLTMLDLSQNTSLIELYCNSNSLNTLNVNQNTALTRLNCRDNSLNVLDVSQNTVLDFITCGDNNLSTLDVSQNTVLTELYCYSNNLSALNVNQNTALSRLTCNDNNISTLDLSLNTVLSRLYCNSNNLSTLDVSQNTDLLWLYCDDNNLSTLDMSQNTSLTYLYCDANNLSSLDLSLNTALTRLDCSDNNLNLLDVANGNNSTISTSNFLANSNPNLTCIKVDDEVYSNSNWTNIDPQSYFNETSCCTVNITDANFKAYLVGNAAINTNLDGEIQCSEAVAFNGTIDCSNLNISDLTGIEAFTSLTQLWCYFNQITNLDISNNLDLTDLRCFGNDISNLNVNSNTALLGLYLGSNQVSSLDVSNNTLLTGLGCGDNLLTSLDISNNVNLNTLYFNSNQISNIDLSNNTALEYVNGYGNDLVNLDLTNNTLLEELECDGNQLTSLDLSNNLQLEYLYCYGNNLNNLDLSNNLALTELECQDNQLINLDIANGNNVNISNFIATGNDNLTCITVDDSTYSADNWTDIDAQSFFSDIPCNVLVESITVQGEGGVNTISVNGGTLQMEAIVLPMNASDDTYTWSISNGTGSATIDLNGLVTASADGTVTVTATANDGSGISGSETVTISNQNVGISDLSKDLSISIYPNPVKSEVTINSNQQIKSISILDIMGKTVMNYTPFGNIIDLSDLVSGTYFILIESDLEIIRKKIIKE